MLTIGTTLAIFLMLGISSLVIFLAKRLSIPHTVLLVIIGIGLGFLEMTPAFSFLSDFKLTPELLFYLLLPTLIFDSAYHMNIRNLVADSKIVLVLSIGGFLVSTAVIAVLLHLALLLIGITIPLSITFLFGALISATDPVAVLALFKEYGVPKRLSLIFEGESLFNDATAVALFLITLEAINNGGLTILNSLAGLLTFSSMLIAGVIFGVLIGGVFSYFIGATREHEVASITLTIVLAHITFILAEMISHTHIFGLFTISISPIISTTVASLLIGNYGRAKMNSKAEHFVGKIWEQFAFMANSLIFILIGVLMVQVEIFEPTILGAIFITVLIVALARAVSIYPILNLFNSYQTPELRIPKTWQHLLAWGSLRGALAVTMILLIPDELSIPGWTLDISPKEFLLSLTIGCIAATLFIKATTIKYLVRKFKLDSLTAIEEIEYQEAQALIHHKVTERLKTYQDRGYLNPEIANNLLVEHTAAYKKACDKISALSQDKREDLAFRVLRIYAIGIEKRNLKILYDHKEVTESVFRRIQGKLRLQLEAIEEGNLAPDVTIHADGRDIFERFFRSIELIFKVNPTRNLFNEKYMYYRAQAIISRKVLKEINLLERDSSNIFTAGAVHHVYHLYDKFKQNSELKLMTLSDEDPEAARTLAETLAKHSVITIEENVLEDIYRKELITQKLYANLKDYTARTEC